MGRGSCRRAFVGVVVMRVLDLFSCVGCHALGMERAGLKTEALCESNAWRRKQLARNFPGVPIYDDVRTMPAVSADVCFGGPPCQNTSVSAAIHGKRTGASLWGDMFELGLRSGVEWFIVEQPIGNAAWEAKVTGDLSAKGFHVARLEFGAHDVGAPYPRRRVYLAACTSLSRLEIAWQAGPPAIERVARAAATRGDWDPSAIPPFGMDTWRSEGVDERKQRIEALGDSNPPAMAEVLGLCLMAATSTPTILEKGRSL
jgi:DNA (cytosine-5)-methyltransferase 1